MGIADPQIVEIDGHAGFDAAFIVARLALPRHATRAIGAAGTDERRRAAPASLGPADARGTS